MHCFEFGTASRLMLRLWSPGPMVCSWDCVWKLAQIDTQTKRFDVIRTEFTDISQLRAGPGRVVFFGGTPSEARALIDLNLNRGTHRVIRRSSILRDEVRALCLNPGADCIPHGGGRVRPRHLLPAVFYRVRRAGRREGAGARHEPRRADRIRLEHTVARRAILDQPRHRRARGALLTSRIASTARATSLSIATPTFSNAFGGEQHGFRKAENIKRALDANCISTLRWSCVRGCTSNCRQSARRSECRAWSGPKRFAPAP